MVYWYLAFNTKRAVICEKIPLLSGVSKCAVVSNKNIRTSFIALDAAEIVSLFEKYNTLKLVHK